MLLTVICALPTHKETNQPGGNLFFLIFLIWFLGSGSDWPVWDNHMPLGEVCVCSNAKWCVTFTLLLWFKKKLHKSPSPMHVCEGTLQSFSAHSFHSRTGSLPRPHFFYTWCTWWEVLVSVSIFQLPSQVESVLSLSLTGFKHNLTPVIC